MRFFNYLFYRVAGYYLNRWEDVRGPVYGITLVTLMQLFHLWIIFIVAALFSEQVNYYLFEKWESKTFLYSWILYPCLLAYGLNMLKYLKFSKYECYEYKWKDENKSLKKKRGWYIVVYILLTIAITVILAIYRKHNS
jgi:hypothetical protein